MDNGSRKRGSGASWSSKGSTCLTLNGPCTFDTCFVAFEFMFPSPSCDVPSPQHHILIPKKTPNTVSRVLPWPRLASEQALRHLEAQWCGARWEPPGPRSFWGWEALSTEEPPFAVDPKTERTGGPPVTVNHGHVKSSMGGKMTMD